MERILSENIKGRYELVGIQPGEMIINKKTYDFRTITKADADQLYASGCQYLRPVNDQEKKKIHENLRKSKTELSASRKTGGVKPVINGDELLKTKKKIGPTS